MTLSDELGRAPPPLPRGTTVVVEREQEAADGTRVEAGTQARVVELLADGAELELLTLGGARLRVLRGAVRLQRGGETPPAAPLPAVEAWERFGGAIQLVTQVGSRAWNLAGPGSDDDLRGCFLAPFDALASLDPAPEQIEDPAADALYWELDRLLRLALRADPNVLEALHGPVVRATSFGEELVAARAAFLSRRVLGTFGRYALAQLERLQGRRRRNALLEEVAALWRERPELSDLELIEVLGARLAERERLAPRAARREARDALRDLARSLHDKGLVSDRAPASLRAYLAASSPKDPGWAEARSDKPKNAMHLLRVLHSGLRLLEAGEPLIRVEEGPLRTRLLAIKRGEVALDEVLAEARALARRMEEVAERSPLPAEPRREVAERLLRRGRRLAFAEADAHVVWVTAPAQRDPLRAPEPLPEATLARYLAGRPERLLLAAVSGAHAYGFPSPDSDVDLRAVHLAPTRVLLGLEPIEETHAFLGEVPLEDGRPLELDYASHELAKVCALLLRGDGNMLERVLGDYALLEHPRASELRRHARATLHRGYARHYLGFARGLLREHDKERAAGTPRAKPLLYVFRTLLTGERLLRTGVLEVDLRRTLEEHPELSAVREVLEHKRAAGEQALLAAPERFEPLVEHAFARLAAAEAASPLPPEPDPAAREALSRWVAALRLSEG